jgi:hypothetical protein
MSTPSEQQIENVQGNVQNMMDWVNHLHSYLQDIINETYDYIDLDATEDPGQDFVSNLVYGMIAGGIGSIPGMGILGNFLGGMFDSYVDQPPPSLQGVLAGVWDRFDKSFLQANDDLAAIYNDVPGHWDDSYKDPVADKTVAVSAWGDAVTVPSKTSDEYQTMTDDAVAAYRVNLAKELLKDKYQVIGDPQGVFLQGDHDSDAIAFIQKWEKSNPAYYMQAGHDTGGTVCPEKGYTYVEPFLGYGSSDPMFAHAMPKETCDWLMQDDGWGTTTNTAGLATRAEVFCSWGLKCSMNIDAVGKIAKHGYDVPNGCINPGKSKEAEEASIDLELDKVRAKRWHQMFAGKPRARIEHEIIDKALDDSQFLYELIKRPRKTVSELLGIDFPETVTFEVIQERAGEYKMVVPYAGNAQRQPAKPDHWLVRLVKSLVGQKS